jgi:hypothetical protein
MLKLITKVASASFLLALMLASEANAESRLPPCPEDRSVSWDNCHGTVTLPDGGKYVGEFKDGKLNGQGTQTVPDGRKYVGEFKDGKPNGYGTLTFPEGGKYVGEWEDSQSTGLGTLTWPDGVEYVGYFKDNKYNGQGTLTWPEGRKYVGGFKDGKRDGPGTLYPSEGSVIQSGIWKNDTLVEPSAEYSSNKAITSGFRLPEKTDGYLPLILLTIAAIAAIAAIFLMKDRTEPSIRVSSPTAATNVPATQLEGAQQPPQTEQVRQPSPKRQSQASELIQALERLSQDREKGILTDPEFEQEKKRILFD